MLASKKSIMAAQGKVSEQDVEGIDGKVRVLCAKRRDVKRWLEVDNGDVESIVKSVVDENNKPLLMKKDVDELPMSVFNGLVHAILKANGFEIDAKN